MPISRRVNLFEISLTTPGANGAPASQIPLRDALTAISCLEYDADRPGIPSNRYYFKPDGSVRYSFDFAPYGSSLIAGTIAKIDLEGGEVEQGGLRSRLELEDGQGLAVATHFLLNPERRELFLESSVGARQGDVQRYLQDRLDGNMDVPIEGCVLRQLADQDALNRFLNQKGSLGRFEIVLERPHIPAFLTAMNTGSLTSARNIAEAVRVSANVAQNAEVISLELRRDPTVRSGGFGRNLKEALVHIARTTSAEVAKLRGKVENAPDDSGRLEPFNLLESKTSTLITNIETETRRKHIIAEDMFLKMAEAYTNLDRG
jgi:hypothetical protein